MGNLIIRIGLGLLFVWGGMEKFFEGYFGGVGLEKMAGSLQSIGFGFLGETGNYVLAILLAATELIAGLLILANRKLTWAYYYCAVIMLVALITVYFPRVNWMQSMIHIALLTTFLGLGIEANQKKKA
ncbi:DoxX family protein [Urechidicola vernalis]|uniref:DoxX family protein n=1 Tax=Urechidicola vernalis TaxID=3075600 RepID=A0ABU2Y2P4_9FLAO|nr:DoxX family protein [Urechidicola sp. P050]MDT0552472.1 DoxX family protein [Urechidicola sp. P050]